VDYAGTCMHAGERFQWTNAYTLAELIERFGDEYWRDFDDSETLRFCEFGRIEWQVEFDQRGRLRGCRAYRRRSSTTKRSVSRIT